MRSSLLCIAITLSLFACSKPESTPKDEAVKDTSKIATAPPASPTPAPVSEVQIDSALFQKAVRKIFPAAILDKVWTKGAIGIVGFKPPAKEPDYFSTDDRIRRIFAIESMQLFRDVADLDRLQLVVTVDKSQQQVEVTRAEAEGFYRMKFGPMSEEDWRLHFVDLYDTPGSRAAFVKGFTGLRTPTE
jgi:hypothetical protein